MEKLIQAHLSCYDLDIRKTGDARFMDQKVTPDVLCFIAECVVKFLLFSRNKNIEFTVKNIWQLNYFNKNVMDIFSKPDPQESTAKSEYDKFIQQPLKALSYAQVLTCKKSKLNYYKVNNYEILKYISFKEKNAYNFIFLYITKVLSDSGLNTCFEEFKLNNTKNKFGILKDTYINFIKHYTNINTKVEASRIFTKILNPYAAKHRIHGTTKGHYSQNIITYSDLMYNKINWRDRGKDKRITRSQHKRLFNTLSRFKLKSKYA